MATQKIPRLLTPDQYLERERNAEEKHEFLDGRIYAMSGGSPAHSTITVNLTAEVRAKLKGKPCQAFSNDMKVSAESGRLYAYPDLSVVCGTPRFQDEHGDVLRNPRAIFEILLPSTEAYDRGRKFERYQQIASLTDYVLIAQDRPRIEHYARQPDNRWILTIVTELPSSLMIASVGCELMLAEIYDRVEFAAEAEDDSMPEQIRA